MARKTTGGQDVERGRVWRWLLWMVVLAAWLMTAASLASHDPADWPGRFIAPHNAVPVNWVGRAGAWLSHELLTMVGPGVWVLMAGVLVALLHTARRRTVTQPVLRAIGLTLMALSISGLIDLTARRYSWQPIGPGGLFAHWSNAELLRLFNPLGSMVILLLVFWVGAVVAMDQLLALLGGAVLRAGGVLLGRVRLPRLSLPRRPSLGLAGAGAGRASIPLRASGRAVRKTTAPDEEAPGTEAVEDAIDPDAGGLGATESFGCATGPQVMEEEEEEEEEDADDGEEADGDAVVADEPVSAEVVGDAPGAYASGRRQFTPEELREKIRKLSINVPRTARGPAAPPREVDLSGYRFPDIALLEDPTGSFTEDMERIVREQAVQLESALQQYRIEGDVVGIDTGPVITLFEVRLAPGTKVAQLNNVASDIARALKAHNVRIVPNMAGKDTVGIEVPNLTKEMVRLKELMTSSADRAERMRLPMWLGKDASGKSLVADLTSMPHMLIAGTTGSGKSVCMNSVIMSFLFTRRPDELKLVLVDPKMVELSMYRDIPHLMCPVVTEMGKAAAILEWATTKMDERYELLAEAGVRDVAAYNTLTWEQLKERFAPANVDEEARIPKKLPYLVFVVDELADLMMTAREVEGFIVRLAQKARAVGLHLILATQRPQANVVTGLIKSNMPCRISFKVASGMDSRIVLDQKGAELLLGQGDMLYLSPRTSKLVRAQGTFVDDVEIRQVVRFLRGVAEPSYEPQLVQLRSGDPDAEPSERDPLFDDAVQIVLESRRGSVSLLQRRLTIGYSRSSRLVEQMAVAGIIGEYKGSQAREVLVSLEEWEAIKAQAEADSAAEEAEGTIFEDAGEAGEMAAADATEVEDEAHVEDDEDSDAAGSAAETEDVSGYEEEEEYEEEGEGEEEEEYEYEEDGEYEEEDGDEEEAYVDEAEVAQEDDAPAEVDAPASARSGRKRAK